MHHTHNSSIRDTAGPKGAIKAQGHSRSPHLVHIIELEPKDWEVEFERLERVGKDLVDLGITLGLGGGDARIEGECLGECGLQRVRGR